MDVRSGDVPRILGQQEARRRDTASNPFSALWSDEGDAPRGPGNQFGNLPFATYRTLCVRMCDGYYFPVSFSTLPNHFQRDSDMCQQQCAAPAELFYHQNPGGAVEQMVSVGVAPYAVLFEKFGFTADAVVAAAHASLSRMAAIKGSTTGN